MADALAHGLAGAPAARLPRVVRAMVIALLLALILGEAAGRAAGLHTPVRYERTAYGYRVAPEQHITRFGNRIDYESHGLRNAEIAPQAASGTLRVLCLGDSVTNGGARISQQDTLSALLERELAGRGLHAEVLNASAPGWATFNEAGWLRQNGVLDSRLLVLTLSTHDLFQAPAGPEVVDRHPAFPSEAPVLAWGAFLQRYVFSPLFSSVSGADPGVGDVNWGEAEALAARRQVIVILTTAASQGARPLVVLLDQDTTANDAPARGQIEAARAALLGELNARGIGLLTLDDIAPGAPRSALFRDTVHPNVNGNAAIARALAARIITTAAP